MKSAMPQSGRPAFYTLRQAGWILNLRPDSVARAIRTGTLRAVRRRGSLVVPASELVKMLDRRADDERNDVAARREAPGDARSLIEIARQLRRLRPVPDDVLTEIVTRDGRCWWTYPDGDPTEPGEELTDRELAARLCAGCPVQDECLELDLRTAGPHTIGVWGAMTETDRRALFPLWRRAQGREGGPRP